MNISRLILTDSNKDGNVNRGDKFIVDENGNGELDKGEQALIIGKDDPKIDEILDTRIADTLKNGVVKVELFDQYLSAMKTAEKAAQEGMVNDMMGHLLRARRIADEADILVKARIFSGGLSAIEKTGYVNAIPLELALTEGAAQAGSADLMQSHIDMVRKYSEKAGIEIDEDNLARIQRLGYSNAAIIELANAERSAREGNETAARISIDMAKHYAKKVGRELDKDELAKIERLIASSAEPATLDVPERTSKPSQETYYSHYNLGIVAGTLDPDGTPNGTMISQITGGGSFNNGGRFIRLGMGLNHLKPGVWGMGANVEVGNIISNNLLTGVEIGCGANWSAENTYQGALLFNTHFAPRGIKHGAYILGAGMLVMSQGSGLPLVGALLQLSMEVPLP